METFDLTRLTDFDFEAVCKDIFEAEYGVRLEIFSPGADSGVDLRYLQGGGSQLVIQCKHWVRSPRSKLIERIRVSELPKVQKLQPDRYILATSVELTKGAKDKIYNILSPYVKTPSDIYGITEINALLRKHESVVRRHVRLWLTSASVLSALLSKSVLTRSQQLAEELDSTLRTYAPNESYSRAVELLETRHTCVIAGIPGIGKTTLAQVLCAGYVSEGYELVEISADLDEANSLWDEKVAQIYYYDDFLGQTTLEEKLGKNEDSRLLAFMGRVEKSNNKRFILTTREYILAQARQRYEKLHRHRFELHTCVVDMADYTYRARGAILYNHVYASGLGDELKSSFADPAVYVPIIRHPNFNPRVVAATIAEADNFPSVGEDIGGRVLENLRDPRSVWSHIVSHQLKDSDIQLLALTYTFLNGVYLGDLQDLWASLKRSSRDLRTSIATLDGTMLRTYRKSDKIFLSFHNPSVRDFMREYLLEDRSNFLQLINGCSHFEQIEALLVMANERKEALHFFRQNLDIVEPVALSAYESQGLRNDGVNTSIDPAERARVYLHLGRILASEVILECARKAIIGDEAILDASDPDDVLAIIQFLNESDRQSLRDALPDAVDMATEWIMGDLSSWDLMESAKSFLESISGIVPEIAIPDVEDDMQWYAKYAIEAWAEAGPDSMLDHSMMERVLAFAGDYEDPGRTFPGYSEAVDRMPDLDDDSYDYGRRELSGSDSGTSLVQEMRDVADMMGSLRTDDSG
ncbi:restriction endonuclease [Streptomyces graminilatus]|uniref:nSTAND3 domain-containing NTPase n=1 Tax=Streptomyces graminilatus TaxID=1464070 RepID=UPI00099EA448|nr:restriction endonuclease [Streptomyces graminilatus]